jgi:ketosteroid isomerase-like protein
MTGSANYPWISVRRLCASRTVVTALLLAVCAVAPLAAMPRAQRHERRHEIDHLEELWRNAVLKDDTAAMSSLLADDYIGITPFGTVQTKDETLATLRTRRTHIASIEITDRKVRFYGSTALVTSTADVQATTPEGNLSGSYRYTRVYVQDPQGVWKIVSFEANRVLGSGDGH